jgi:hypothetical protein
MNKSIEKLSVAYPNRSVLALGLILILAFVSSCTVRLIAPYDAVTDQQSYVLQEKIMVQFAEWKRGVGPLDDYHSFYDEVDVMLTILIDRNRQIPDSEHIVGMLERVHENIIVIVRELHNEDELNAEVLEQIQPDIMAQFSAIQKFQMALKRSENVNRN